MIKKRERNISNIDWLSVFIVFTLMILGWISIYASVFDENHSSIFDLSQRYGKQLLWITVAIPLSAVVFILDSKFYSSFAYILYIVGILLLIAVLLFGIEVNASKSWFVIGGFRVQPAEFVKFMLSLALAYLLSDEGFSFNKISSLIKLSVLLGLPILLVILQNDTGTALVFFALVFVLYREGLNSSLFFIGLMLIALFVFALLINTYLLILSIGLVVCIFYYFASERSKNAGIILITYSLLAGTTYLLEFVLDVNISISLLTFSAIFICVGLMLFYAVKSKHSKLLLTYASVCIVLSFFVYSVDYAFDNFLQEHQQNRINEILGKHHDPLGVGYNLHQSKIAIGSGGLTGKGFLQGTQTKFNFVPEQSTDFIFCSIAEEWGLLGTTVVFLLYTVLLLRFIFIAERQRSSFSRIYAYCVVSILFFHIVINLGMTVGVAPIVGIPLPFFSYGGSSLWAFSILVMVLLKLDSNRKQVFR